MLTTLTQPILIVEDSDEDFEAVGRIMRRSAVTNPLFRCRDGDDALDFLYRTGAYVDPQNAPRPALILLDLNLPGTDGREVLEQIKQDENFKNIPVLVFTTSSNPKDVEECYKNGANGYILKPIDLNRFIEMMRVVIDYWFKVMILPETTRRLG
jgi:CheY-like chemotaxis protein